MRINFLKLSRYFVILCILSLVVNGCGGLAAKKGTKTGEKFSLFKKLDKDTKPLKPAYYEFKNILIPGELKEIKDKTFIVRSSDLVSGAMLFNGSVEGRSLEVFFKTNMKNDGWQQVSFFKSSYLTSLLFNMENEWALISISEETYTTDVRICVAPALYKVKGM